MKRAFGAQQFRMRGPNQKKRGDYQKEEAENPKTKNLKIHISKCSARRGINYKQVYQDRETATRGESDSCRLSYKKGQAF